MTALSNSKTGVKAGAGDWLETEAGEFMLDTEIARSAVYIVAVAYVVLSDPLP